MSKSNKLVFFGNERIATSATTTAPVLRALVHAGYEIEAVIASHKDPVSRQKRDLEIGAVAHAYRIPVILPGDKFSLASKVVKHPAEAAVLVAFGKIIPAEVINMFPKGIINIHPSLLPKYRGPTPIETAILDGVKKTGVSLMKLTKEMDAGPVWAQAEVELSGQETKQELADILLKKGSELLADNIDAILDGSLKPAAQNESNAVYTKLLSKADGFIGWDEPAQTIERKVRAFAGFPKTTAKLFDKYLVTITKARVAKDKNDGDLVIKCSPGWLEVTELITPNGKRTGGADFLRGYKP